MKADIKCTCGPEDIARRLVMIIKWPSGVNFYFSVAYERMSSGESFRWPLVGEASSEENELNTPRVRLLFIRHVRF